MNITVKPYLAIYCYCRDPYTLHDEQRTCPTAQQGNIYIILLLLANCELSRVRLDRRGSIVTKSLICPCRLAIWIGTHLRLPSCMRAFVSQHIVLHNLRATYCHKMLSCDEAIKRIKTAWGGGGRGSATADDASFNCFLYLVLHYFYHSLPYVMTTQHK